MRYSVISLIIPYLRWKNNISIFIQVLYLSAALRYLYSIAFIVLTTGFVWKLFLLKKISDGFLKATVQGPEKQNYLKFSKNKTNLRNASKMFTEL